MRTVVGVLRGGPSSEYDVSLQSGANVLSALDTEKYEPRDIYISRSGDWHVHGLAVDPERALRGVDVAFNVVHGHYGEDGRLQRILETLAVPYTGADAFASALAFDKHRTREIVAPLGVKIAHARLLESPTSPGELEDMALELFRSFPHPAMVKPVIGGSSVGTNLASTYHGLEFALETAFAHAPQVLVEEYIKGKEASVGVLDQFRGQKTYALLPAEIIPPPGNPFFDYEAKYSGRSIERVPGNFTPAEKSELERLAKVVHEGLGLSHYSRSDFIVSKRGIYFLEVNSAAAVGLTKESLLPKALHAVGAKFSDFLDHVIALARGRRN